MIVRTGIGYDSHRFAPGGPMRLGGVDIPVTYKLRAHSDGDAVAHAVEVSGRPRRCRRHRRSSIRPRVR